MAYWLVKSEPDTYSIDDFRSEKATLWDGVRNYQARNFLQEMEKGEQVLFYHSNAKPPSVVGIAKVSKKARPDPTQFDPKSEYYDPKADPENPRWFCPELRFVKKFKQALSISELKEEKKLDGMLLLKRGTRLSVQKVEKKHFERILEMAQAG